MTHGMLECLTESQGNRNHRKGEKVMEPAADRNIRAVLRGRRRRRIMGHAPVHNDGGIKGRGLEEEGIRDALPVHNDGGYI